jgi:hypothetical protein
LTYIPQSQAIIQETSQQENGCSDIHGGLTVRQKNKERDKKRPDTKKDMVKMIASEAALSMFSGISDI